MLYYLNEGAKQNLQMLKRTTLERVGWKEEDLEELITKNLNRILDEENLMPIFTERKFQEEPDIMALDQTGKLYIFELKRWESKDENLLQVLRYGQIYGQKNYEELENLFFTFNGNGKSLFEEHQEYFNLSEEQKIGKDQFNVEQHFLIITDGTDLKTRAAINYWKKTGLNIDSIIYRVYLTNSNEKLIEFNTYSPYQDVIEQEESYYILNTNIVRNPDAHHDMLDNGKAAAYYHPWKNKIKKIEKGDRVFLYQSGKGIVAIGTGTGIINKATYQGTPEAEYSTKLADFVKLPTPLSAAEIREITGVNVVFNQTMFSLKNEKGNTIWNHIMNAIN